MHIYIYICINIYLSLYIHIYIYILLWISEGLTQALDFRGFDSSTILNLRGGNSQAHRVFTGEFESSNASRDNVSREIGRKH